MAFQRLLIGVVFKTPYAPEARIGECKMAEEKVQGKTESFSTLGIASSIMYSYISGSTSLTTSD
jgi:hypothetical protein